MDLPLPEEFESLVQLGYLEDELQKSFKEKWARQVLENNEWGRPNGRSTFITGSPRENLFAALEGLPRSGRALDVDDVDVKDLLETGRLVVERAALKEMISRHQSDLVSNIFVANGALPRAPESGQILVE
jgi:large subunit ribosomal protein L4